MAQCWEGANKCSASERDVIRCRMWEEATTALPVKDPGSKSSCHVPMGTNYKKGVSCTVALTAHLPGLWSHRPCLGARVAVLWTFLAKLSSRFLVPGNDEGRAHVILNVRW